MEKKAIQTPCALTIAGSDPSGGAGIQADLKTFYRFKVYGMSVVSLLTVQNTRTVYRVEMISADLVEAQIAAVLSDIKPAAIKTGALGDSRIIETVAHSLKRTKIPLVVDPVMVSKHGKLLLSKRAAETMAEQIFPLTDLLTPNISEAEYFTGMSICSVNDMIQAAVRIAQMGPKAVLVKGGHKKGSATDVLFWNDKIKLYHSPRFSARNTHGTGCTYSAAITAGLALGMDLDKAVLKAKEFISKAIQTAPNLGRGIGPVNHFA